ncbi:MAG: C39 family peptidase [Candidatus Omnitrophica bacterium]|nr:C39 family peptidase [Candidatus Omnitrophota bacterium]MBU1046989.1 C39 family peptidase [Candidatus Omnitrophota bacterium]MBU1631310.1 C39 family peptidase [Candidatus Omnitrophota bacterium]MBU1889535.1 C39 family peptidase [Candidatus Omnitrophota bacterium]
MKYKVKTKHTCPLKIGRREDTKWQRFSSVPLCLCASVPVFIALMFLFLTPSYAKMKTTRDPNKAPVERRIFLKSYRGTLDEGHIIENVPFYKQEKRNYCGPTVLSMVLNYWDEDKVFTQEEIVKDIFDQNVEITNNSKMVFYPYDNDFYVRSFNGDMEKLKNLIREKIPVIILQRVVGKIVNKGHYRVVVGYDDVQKVMIINDPWFGENLAISYNVFSELWAFGKELNKNNWALVILPKEKGRILDKLAVKESAVTYHNIATALYSRSRISEAIKQWQKAIEISPEEVTFFYCVSYAYIQEEDYGEAIRYGKLAVELDDNNSFAYDTLGWAYYKKGMLKEALQKLEKATQLSPKIEFIKNHYNIVAEEISK